MSGRRVFMTGARGLLGSEHLRRILEWEPETEVCVLLRGVDDEVVAQQGAALLADLIAEVEARTEVARRVRFLRGDVALPGLGLTERVRQELAHTITDIVHAAADVRFYLPVEDARAVNLDGTRHVHELALLGTRAGALRRLCHVSTYAVGAPAPGDDVVLEIPPVPRTRYANTYEQTKAEAEAFLAARAGEVPLMVLRPSIIGGDSRTGWTLDFKVFYIPLRLYARGQLPPGRPMIVRRGGRCDTLYLDTASDRMYALSCLGDVASGTIFNVVAGREAIETAPLLRRGAEDLRDIMIEHGRRPPPPLEFEEVDELDSEALRERLGDENAFATMEPLLPYFSQRVIYDDSNTRRALMGHPLHRRFDDEGSPRRLVEYCVVSQWGRRPRPRPPLVPPGAGT